MKLSNYPVEPQDIAHRIEWVLICLQDPPDENVVLGAVLAIRSLVGSFHYVDRQRAPAQAVCDAAAALTGLAERIAAEATPLDQSYVLSGIHSAVRVLSLFGLSSDLRVTEAAFEHVLDDLDHAVLLTDELSATLRRRSIAAREAAGLRPLQSVPYPSAGGSLH